MKAKLPRKRKKAAIKAQGRKWYYDTIHLAKVTNEYPCKFWDNSSVTQQPISVGAQVLIVPKPTRYW